MRLFPLWIVQVTRVVGREHRFGTWMAQETIPSGFPVFWVVVLECCRNSYGTSPNLWVQKKFVKLRQNTQDKWLRPVQHCGKFFFWTPPSIFSETRQMYSWVIPGCDWLFLVFSGFSLEIAANFLLFLNFVNVLRDRFCQLWRLKWVFILITKANISSYYEGKVLTQTKS